MTQARETVTFKPGEVILYPGVPGPRDRVYRVLEGLVRLEAVDEEGNALTLRLVRPGGYFGEEALAGMERTYFAEAVTEVVAEPLPKEPHPEEIRQVLLSLAQALSESYRRIERLATQRLKNRMAAAILELAETPLAHEEPEGLVLRATHDELAAAVGSVRETVTKVIGELTREGYIRSGYGKIILKDIRGLKELAQSRGDGR
ncbi:Crp/Fnr family transcriptional regulator [Thermus scotoductus]|jgi:CRP-like cAMP-binding protein|uniref:Crp/Fnr family transcriptional regulator n=2 Tax=Thermus TaxID=270 RepID=A0A0N0IPQ0_THESC|nr:MULTISPECIES: helix-turn-helix domain-containing protein [Thermus]ETN88274.1 Crp/Fnr family transcriptional regulator [Thermus sp. NMX2.A1]KPD25991.1 Crp/Fnr family transcriptional regulator [Thermus scotoductus]MBW6395976.1 helix-turn-helix domain-containing protein [Thermus brevis]RTG94341.1 Crp/Fnr family transcriptional regulator [Thermus scotoductus]RTH07330.1 Crp/Fnr family transcriptional regulator [Thermus scotoductus]